LSLLATQLVPLAPMAVGQVPMNRKMRVSTSSASGGAGVPSAGHVSKVM